MKGAVLLGFVFVCLIACQPESPTPGPEVSDTEFGAFAGPWETVEAGSETRCSDGSPYRFHVRRGDPDQILLYFNGGGACWNSATCDPDSSSAYRMRAGEGDGNDPREYDGAFALDNPENPFRDWSQVFVSYCSGDVHLGHRTSEYEREDGSLFTIHHYGRVNSDAALEYLQEELPPAKRFVVAGGSAGAIASPIFAAVVAKRFPDAEVIQLGGGGAGYRVPPPVELWRTWGLVEALPDELEPDRISADTLLLADFYKLAADVAPDVRYHSYDNAYDAVQERFMELLGAPGDLLPGLDENLEDMQRAVPNLRYYVAPGDFHTLLRHSELYTRVSAGIRVLDWVEAIVTGNEVDDVHCGPDECREEANPSQGEPVL